MPSSTFPPSRRPALIGILVIIALLLAVRISSAQESVLFGIGGRYEFGIPLDIRHDAGGINDRTEFDGSGTSYNHTGWFGASWTAPSAFGHGWGITGSFGIAISAGRFTSVPFTTRLQLDSATFRLYQPIHRLDVSSNVTDFRWELAWRYQPSRFAFTTGLWLTYRIASTFTGTDSITSANGGPASIAGTSTKIGEQQLANGPLRGGALLSTSYLFPIGAFTLQWDVTGRVDAGALDLGVRALSVGSGFTLLLGAHPLADSTLIAPPPAAPPRKPRLTARVDIYSDDGNAKAVVHRKDVFHRTVAPLIPILFFDSSSTSIASRYHRLRKEETRAFTLDSLAGLDATGIYYQTLNVIGLRMREHPKAVIELLGSESAEENMEVAQARAESIRRYLTDVWGIAANRMDVATDHGGGEPTVRAQARRAVRVVTTSTDISRPIPVEWLGRDLTAPSIGVDQQIEAEAGVKEWTVDITQGDKSIGHYASTDRKRMDGLSLSFLLDADRDAPLPPLVAELTVIDSTGATIAAHDTLPITWTGDSLTEVNNDESAAEDLLQYLFLYPGASQAADAASLASRTVGDIVKSGSSVTVTIPAASAEGSTLEHNWGMSLAGRLLTDLQTRGISVDRFEIATSPGPPDELPEEDILSQGVTVVVEQDRPDRSGSR